MNVKGLLKGVLTALVKVIDSDHDGKVELSDLPGALANVATMRLHGQALISAAADAVQGFKALASAGNLTSHGQPITAEQVDAAWDQAIAVLHQAGDEARARLAKDGGQ